jgi:hypothetical protein
MTAIAYTWVRDYRQMAEDMRTSFHHFHPDVPLCIFDWEQCQMIMEKYSCTSSFLYAPLGKELATGSNVVIHIDADIIVTGPLDRLFDEAYDVAGVRALPDQGLPDGSKYRRQNRLTGDHLTTDTELNAGFFAVRDPSFWDAWIALNKQYGTKMRLGEQDTLNDLFHSGRYRSLLLDPINCNELWGTATKWGKALGHGNDMEFLESWRNLFLKTHSERKDAAGERILYDEPQLMMEVPGKKVGASYIAPPQPRSLKRVHMLHTAGGDWKDKQLGFDSLTVREKLSPEVWAYLQNVRGRQAT